MRKIILACALLCFGSASAQTQQKTDISQASIRSFEVEIGGGMVFGASRLNFDQSKLGGMGYVEARYNFRRIPIDAGLQIAGSVFHRRSDYAGELGFPTWNVTAVADYNFRRTRNISFFAGLGVGYVSLEDTAPIVFEEPAGPISGGSFSTGGSGGSFCLMPRIGMEILQHLRITFDYKLQEKANRHCSLTLGIVFGGGRKR